MAKPVGEMSFGRVKIAKWENEYNGQVSTSYSISKSFKKKDGTWENTTFFYDTDLRDIYVAIGAILAGQVKKRKPQENQEPKSEPTKSYDDDLEDDFAFLGNKNAY